MKFISGFQNYVALIAIMYFRKWASKLADAIRKYIIGQSQNIIIKKE